jgi:hypothetical protein
VCFFTSSVFGATVARQASDARLNASLMINGSQCVP